MNLRGNSVVQSRGQGCSIRKRHLRSFSSNQPSSVPDTFVVCFSFLSKYVQEVGAACQCSSCYICISPEVLPWTELAVELQLYRELHRTPDFIFSYKLTLAFAKVSIIIYLLMSSQLKHFQDEKLVCQPPLQSNICHKSLLQSIQAVELKSSELCFC